MFWNCNSLKALDLSSWDTSNVINMNHMFSDCNNLVDIRFGPDWFNSKDMVSLNLSTCGKDKGYKLSDETYESMLTMYDRQKYDFDFMTIYFNKDHNIPNDFIDKVEAKGYDIRIK